MRKALFVLTIAISLVILTACTSTTPAPVVTKTVEVPAEIPANPTVASRVNESDMIDAVRLVHPDFWGVDESVIVDVGYLMCQELRDGSTALEVGSFAESYLGTDAAAAMLAGAIVYLCPDQEYKLG